MSVIDEVLAANEIYSRTHELRKLTPCPARKLAVLTCMDTRLSIRTLGLKTGDAHVIRNAGGIVTDDTLRSLLVSHYLLDTEEFMVINHTDCGLMNSRNCWWTWTCAGARSATSSGCLPSVRASPTSSWTPSAS